MDDFGLVGCFGLRVVIGRHSLDHLFADFCHTMVVVGAVGTVNSEESKLRLMLFSFDEYFLELGAIQSYVLGSCFDKF